MSEIRQRWRLVFARGEAARYLSHLDAVHLWERAFRRGEIPLATTEGFNSRPKLIFAAPLQLGMLAEHELADLYLSERLTAPDMRRRLTDGMPSGYDVVDLYDVWVGAPALAPQLVAADYRTSLFSVEPGPLEAAIARLLAATALPRERHREKKTIAYDLRPLLLDARVRAPDPAAITPETAGLPVSGLWLRLRHAQDGGSGRLEEVIAALAEVVDPPADPAADAPAAALESVLAVRERLWLAGELPAAEPTGGLGVESGLSSTAPAPTHN
jgi:radical SAM-linked protein